MDKTGSDRLGDNNGGLGEDVWDMGDTTLFGGLFSGKGTGGLEEDVWDVGDTTPFGEYTGDLGEMAPLDVVLGLGVQTAGRVDVKPLVRGGTYGGGDLTVGFGKKDNTDLEDTEDEVVDCGRGYKLDMDAFV